MCVDMKTRENYSKAVNMIPSRDRMVATRPRQLDLFHQWINGDHSFSQGIRILDTAPLYVYGKQDKYREHGKYLRILERTSHVDGVEYTYRIKPARIVDQDGEEKEYYPGKIEDLVEMALRKIAFDGGGVSIGGFYGVEYTPYEVRTLLKSLGHTYSHSQIAYAIKKLGGARYDLSFPRGDKIAVIEDIQYLGISGHQLDGDRIPNPKEKSYVLFSPFVTQSVNELRTRRFNINRCMSYKNAGAKWLEMKLSLHFLQAGPSNPYTVNLTSLVRDSNIGQGLPLRRQHQYWVDIMDEMQATEEQMKPGKDPNKVGPIGMLRQKKVFTQKPGTKRKILKEVTFTIFPSSKFTKEMIESNQMAHRVVANSTFAEFEKMSGQLPELPA